MSFTISDRAPNKKKDKRYDDGSLWIVRGARDVFQYHTGGGWYPVNGANNPIMFIVTEMAKICSDQQLDAIVSASNAAINAINALDTNRFSVELVTDIEFDELVDLADSIPSGVQFRVVDGDDDEFDTDMDTEADFYDRTGPFTFRFTNSEDEHNAFREFKKFAADWRC